MKAILREPDPKDGALLALVLDALLLAVIAAQHWHRTRDQTQQAEGARQTADHLRAAYRTAATKPLTALHNRGQNLAQWLLKRHTAAVRQRCPTWPSRSSPNLACPPSPPASTTPRQLVTATPPRSSPKPARHRDLDTATTLSKVLTWRLIRLRETSPGKSPRTKSAGRVQPDSSPPEESFRIGTPPLSDSEHSPCSESDRRLASDQPLLWLRTLPLVQWLTVFPSHAPPTGTTASSWKQTAAALKFQLLAALTPARSCCRCQRGRGGQRQARESQGSHRDDLLHGLPTDGHRPWLRRHSNNPPDASHSGARLGTVLVTNFVRTGRRFPLRGSTAVEVS